MSGHLHEVLGDVLSDNVQELLNGELFNAGLSSRRQRIKGDHCSSVNTEICQSILSKSFSSLQDINSNCDFSAMEGMKDFEVNGYPPPEDSEIPESESLGKMLVTENAIDELKDDVESEVEHLKKLVKEKDLQLLTAAQYGISLVNKSDELEAQLEKEKELFRQKLEEANNERHQLKRLLEIQSAEHQTIVVDLKADLTALKKVLEEERKHAKNLEKEYQEKIQELTACNEVLSEQILSASIHEEEARNQVCNLRLQVSECETEQCDQIQALQNELSEVRLEMERMVCLKADECKILSDDLDVTQAKLADLVREKKAEVAKVQQLQDELTKLEDKYVILLSKMESPTASIGSTGSTNPNEMSLFAELDVLTDAATTFDLLSTRHSPNGKFVIGTQLRQEILEVYRQVQRLIMEVKGQGKLWSPEIVDIADLKAGQLLLALSELQDLMSRRFSTTTLPPLNDERSRLESQVSYLKEQSNILREQLSVNQVTLDSVKAELVQRNHQLRHSSEEKALLEKSIADLKEEVMDLQRSLDEWRMKKVEISRDDILQEIQKERDEAILRRQSVEDQLVRLKLDLNSLDHQLIESVEQKLQLSNQLEAWQNDMHDLIEDKMAGEIARDSLKGRKRSSTSTAHHPVRPSYLKKFTLRWS